MSHVAAAMMGLAVGIALATGCGSKKSDKPLTFELKIDRELEGATLEVGGKSEKIDATGAAFVTLPQEAPPVGDTGTLIVPTPCGPMTVKVSFRDDAEARAYDGAIRGVIADGELTKLERVAVLVAGAPKNVKVGDADVVMHPMAGYYQSSEKSKDGGSIGMVANAACKAGAPIVVDGVAIGPAPALPERAHPSAKRAIFVPAAGVCYEKKVVGYGDAKDGDAEILKGAVHGLGDVPSFFLTSAPASVRTDAKGDKSETRTQLVTTACP